MQTRSLNFPVVLAVALLASALLLSPLQATADVKKEAKCLALKLKAAGKQCLCRHKALAKAAIKNTEADYARCDGKFTSSFAKAEIKGQGFCRAGGDPTVVGGRMSVLASSVAVGLGTSDAGDKGARKCRAAMLKAAGKHCLCHHKAHKKARKRGGSPDFAKCESKLAASFAKARQKGGAACPAQADEAELAVDIGEAAAEVDADLADLGTSDFSITGPYAVGYSGLTLVDDTRSTDANGVFPGSSVRTLDIQVWYPAVKSQFGGFLIDVPVVASSFPLIIRAHGFGGTRTDSTKLTEHLASHGYIVVAPNFPLSNLYTPGGAVLSDLDEQVLDVSFLIDKFLAFSADSDSLFYGRIDATRIGTTGHSLGGATVLLNAFHQDLYDPRVGAVVALAPLSCFMADGFFGDRNVPLMIMGGTGDLVTPFFSNQARTYALVNAPKSLVALDEGTHMGFVNDFTPGANGDEALFCGPLFPPGTPRPSAGSFSMPENFLGGAAAGIDLTGSECEPICPWPPPTFMPHPRQLTLVKAATLSFFHSVLDDSRGAGRFVETRMAADNGDVSTEYVDQPDLP